MESENRKDPTPQDLQNLEIEVAGLGSGALVHAIEHNIGMLRRIIGHGDAKKNPWPDYLRESWNKTVIDINKDVAKRRLERAREEGF